MAGVLTAPDTRNAVGVSWATTGSYKTIITVLIESFALHGLISFVFLKFLLCRMSRAIIMSMRRILSKTKIQSYEIWREYTSTTLEKVLFWCKFKWVTMMPITTLATSIESDLVDLKMTLARTYGGKVQKERKDGNPVVCTINDVATIYLEWWPTLNI